MLSEQPWEQDPDAWKGEARQTNESCERLIAALQRATLAFQRLSDMIAVWELIHGPIEEE